MLWADSQLVLQYVAAEVPPSGRPPVYVSIYKGKDRYFVDCIISELKNAIEGAVSGVRYLISDRDDVALQSIRSELKNQRYGAWQLDSGRVLPSSEAAGGAIHSA